MEVSVFSQVHTNNLRPPQKIVRWRQLTLHILAFVAFPLLQAIEVQIRLRCSKQCYVFAITCSTRRYV